MTRGKICRFQYFQEWTLRYQFAINGHIFSPTWCRIQENFDSSLYFHEMLGGHITEFNSPDLMRLDTRWSFSWTVSFARLFWASRSLKACSASLSSLCHKTEAGKFSYLQLSSYLNLKKETWEVTCSSNIPPEFSQVLRLNLLSVVADNHKDPEALSVSAQKLWLLNDLGIN